jgi:xylan 1,4-beta-xylosidase
MPTPRRVILTISLFLITSLPAMAQDSVTAITIDAAAASHPFPHFWERMFGSGRANLALREGYRDDLRTVADATGFEYVRFHGIFDDENGVYSEDDRGNPIYNWSYVDQIYDGLLKNHIRPFVELSFMPSKLSSTQHTHAFWYKPFPNPPKDYAKWGALNEAFARHLIDRYGIDEVSQWLFEVWNEPNIDFWTGEPADQTYFQLYASAANALKKVSPRIRVGGPATAQAAWVGKLVAYCVKNNVPVDFASTHVYGNDKAEDVFGTHEQIPRRDMVARSVSKVHDEIKGSAMPNLPLYWSEFNASYFNEVEVTDSPFIGPWLANTIRMCDGLVDMMSYWTFSDVFEEQGVVKTPFYGGFGLIAEGNIPKASLNDFRLLHQLGETRVANDSDSVLVTRRKDGSLALVLWNYAAPEEAGAPRRFSLNVTGVKNAHRIRITQVDAQHGSSLAAWESMGKPAFPTREQQAKLRAAGAMPGAQEMKWKAGAPVAIELQPKSLALVEVMK